MGIQTPNSEVYKINKSWVDKILPEIIALEFEAYQKLEWNCQGDAFNLKKKIVTFRASGVRIRRNKNSPTLVSASITQVPYLPWKNRYLSHEECLKSFFLEKYGTYVGFNHLLH